MNVDRTLTRVLGGVGRLFARLPTLVQVAIWIVLIPVIIVLATVLTLVAAVVGLIRGIFFRLFPPPASRDVSRLDPHDADLDVLRETIEDEGELLKEHQFRKIHRDPRLLPKPMPPPDVWPRPKRKKVMQADEANRLYAGTLRTKNRRIRDLLADVEQLERYRLPIWKTEADVAEVLGLTVKQLRHYSIHRNDDRICHYVTFAIPKRNGESRLIMAPKTRLKRIQRSLLNELVDRLPVNQHAHGFLRGRSIRSGAEPHVGKAVVLKMDIKDFFPSVTFGRVRGFLIAMGYSYPVATTLAVVMTEAERQPVNIDGELVYVPIGQRHCVQGAPTSPGLCNALCMRLDRRMAGVAKKYGWQYTRYADDLTFSGDSIEHSRTIQRLVNQICEDEGFSLNPDKTRLQRRGRRQSVTGVVVNETAGLSRKDRRTLRATIHRLNGGASKPATLTQQQMAGKLAYLQMLNSTQADALRLKWKNPNSESH